jgi:epoxide hydrolase-like predicted phosphatase
MDNKIKFIYFDFGGVFFNWDNYFKKAADKFAFDRQQIIRFFNKNNEAITKGHISSQKFWEMFQEEMGIENAESFDFLASWVEDYMPLPSVHRFAKTLSKHYKVGVISNIYKGMHPLLIEKGRIPDISFDTTVLSCEVGLQKPEIEIYELAQSKIHYKGKEVLFIDDVESYIDSAKNMGWQTFQFETNNVDKSLADLERLLS